MGLLKRAREMLTDVEFQYWKKKNKKTKGERKKEKKRSYEKVSVSRWLTSSFTIEGNERTKKMRLRTSIGLRWPAKSLRNTPTRAKWTHFLQRIYVMCICICIHIYTYVYTYMYIYPHRSTTRTSCAQGYILLCIHIYIYNYSYKCMYAYIHIYIRIHIDIYSYIHIHTHMYIICGSQDHANTFRVGILDTALSHIHEYIIYIVYIQIYTIWHIYMYICIHIYPYISNRPIDICGAKIVWFGPENHVCIYINIHIYQYITHIYTYMITVQFQFQTPALSSLGNLVSQIKLFLGD